jgi:hypothetical protein
VIVAAELTQDANDFQQLQPMLDAISAVCRRSWKCRPPYSCHGETSLAFWSARFQTRQKLFRARGPP